MVIDAKKLEDYFVQRLVSASRGAHGEREGSFNRIKLTKEMEIFTSLIAQVQSGKFTYRYEVLEDALEDFDSFVLDGSEKVDI